MCYYIYSGEDTVSELILAKFKILVSKNYSFYENQCENNKKILLDKKLFRITFEPFIDPVIIFI